MATSLIATIKEMVREGATGDENFYKSLPYYFKLHTEPNKGPTGLSGEAMFPLPMAPQVFEYDLPFAAEISPAQEGGVVVEEAGIVIGSIKLQGTTGWKLRKSKDTSFPPGQPRFASLLCLNETTGQPISGQMALWRLLGRCFDAYSELKKDPQTGPKTRLEFHSIKEKLHLEVIPRSARVTRDKGNHRLTYGYAFELDVIGPAKEPSLLDLLALEDETSWFNNIMDTIKAVRKMARGIAAAIDDLTAIVNNIKNTITSIANIISDVTSILNAANDFLDGVKSFVDIPAQFTNNVLAMVAAAGQEAEVLSAVDLNNRGFFYVCQTFKALEDDLIGLDVQARLLARKDWENKITDLSKRMAKHGHLSAEEKEAIADLAEKAAAAQGCMRVQDAFGSGVRPGDAKRIEEGDENPDMQPGQYHGFTEVVVGQGDTIESLANRYLGDPARAREIAIINRLKHPYVSSGRARIPGTKAYGDPILIPAARDMGRARAMHRGDPADGASQAATLMGIDVKTARVGWHVWGWLVDTAHGSVDVQSISGIDNLVQGLENRMRTEHGTDLCFPAVGLTDFVGSKSAGDIWMEAYASVARQVKADPRIDQVAGVEFAVEQDVLEITVRARPIGYDSSRPIPLVVE